MDLRGYLRALRKNWWIVGLLVVLGVGAGFYHNVTATKQYQSKVTFFVATPSANAAGSAAFQADEYAQRRVNSYVLLMKSDLLGSRIVEATGVKLSARAVANRITASSDINTVILTGKVLDSSPSRSLRLATALATTFPALVDDLDNPSSTATNKATTLSLHVTSGPSLAAAPVSPRKTLSLIIGLVIGLALGVLLALLRELIDTSLRSLNDLRSATDRALLGVVRVDRKAKKAPLITAAESSPERAEAFRTLRTNLQFMDVADPVKSIVVTSASSGDGRSTVAANLALVFAEAGKKVLLVEADLRRPALAGYLRLERPNGLSNVLAGQLPLADAVQTWESTGVSVLVAGAVPPNPSELLSGQRMVALVDQVRADYDVVIYDTPPLLAVTDAAVVAANADGVVLVARYGKTNPTKLAAAEAAVTAVDGRILGVVLNRFPGRWLRRRGYGSVAKGLAGKTVPPPASAPKAPSVAAGAGPGKA